MTSALIVGNDSQLNSRLVDYLINRGFAVTCLTDYSAAAATLSGEFYNFAVFCSPHDGSFNVDISESLRRGDKITPILFVNSKSNKILLDNLIPLIDERIETPFSASAFNSKIDLLLSRSAVRREKNLVFGNVPCNASSRRAYLIGRAATLPIGEKKFVYVVLSHTGTMLSRIIKRLTKGKYNHASICLDDGVKTMYSFGRLNPYNPVKGGFVRESPSFGTFKRFKNTRAVIMKIPVDDVKFNALENYLSEMYENRSAYGYNYFGLFFASLNIPVSKRRHFFCSEFVSEILKKFEIIDGSVLPDIVKPMDLYKLPYSSVVYTGKLSAFAEDVCKSVKQTDYTISSI